MPTSETEYLLAESPYLYHLVKALIRCGRCKRYVACSVCEKTIAWIKDEFGKQFFRWNGTWMDLERHREQEWRYVRDSR